MHNESFKVLVIEDDPQHLNAIDAMLGRVPDFYFELMHAYKLGDGLELIRNKDPHVILLDLGLPDSSGFDTFRNVHENAPDIPILILTSLFDEEIALTTLNNGAQEYLFKGEFDGEDLATAIKHSIERIEYINYLLSIM